MFINVAKPHTLVELLSARSETSHIMTSRLPAYFIAHGAPTLVLENNRYTAHIKKIAARHPKPSAVVIFSAHWESGVQMIGGAAQYSTIHDFYGFPAEMYEIQYRAIGKPALADKVKDLLTKAGIPSEIDTKRGLDHGSWVLLRLMYPDADIPVVAMSVNPHAKSEELYAVGKAIASLRDENVLILGSGGTSHNLGKLYFGMKEPAPWAFKFEQWITDVTTKWNTKDLFQYDTLAPHAKDAVPTAEHFAPFLVAMGAGDVEKQAEQEYKDFQAGSLSLITWKF